MKHVMYSFLTAAAFAAVPSSVLATRGVVNVNEIQTGMVGSNVEMVRIEYLESTGTQWMDIGVKTEAANAPLGFSITANVLENSASSPVALLGAIGETSTLRDYMYVAANATKLTFDNGITYTPSTAIVNTKMDAAGWPSGTSSISYSLNGSSSLRSGTPSTSQLNWYLFACNNNGTPDYHSKMRFYSLFIQSNSGTQLMKLVPVRIGHVGYLYDLLNDKLYANQGTGAFVLGPDIIERTWVYSPGASYIKTGIKTSDSSGSKGCFGFDCKFKYDGVFSSTECETLFGSETYVSSSYRMEWLRVHKKNGYVECGNGAILTSIAGYIDTYHVIWEQTDASNFKMQWRREDGPWKVQTKSLEKNINNLEWYLFGRNNNGTADKISAWTLYHLKVFDYDKNTKGWFVGATCNGVNYVYDKWNNKLLSLEGGGLLTVGPEKANEKVANIDYLESDGTQYVRLGMNSVGNPSSRKATPFEVKFEANDVTTDQTVFGTTDGTKNTHVKISSGNLVIANGAALSGVAISAATPYVLKTSYVSDTVMRIELTDEAGTVLSSQDVTITEAVCDKEWYLFGRNNGGLFDSGFKGKIHYLKAYASDGTLIREYKGKRIGTKGYLYDSVSGQFYCNSGSGDFTIGPDSDEVDIEYLSSTGTQYIKLGIQSQGTAYTDFIPCEIKFRANGTISSADGGYDLVCGAERYITYSSYNGDEFYIYRSGTTGKLGVENGCTYTTESMTFNPTTIALMKNTSTRLTMIKTVGTTTTTNTYSLSKNPSGKEWYLFAGHSYNVSGVESVQYGKVSIYYLKVYDQDGTTLLHHWVPKRKGNIGYMKDLVTGVNYYNAGTGYFDCGPDLL